MVIKSPNYTYSQLKYIIRRRAVCSTRDHSKVFSINFCWNLRQVDYQRILSLKPKRITVLDQPIRWEHCTDVFIIQKDTLLPKNFLLGKRLILRENYKLQVLREVNYCIDTRPFLIIQSLKTIYPCSIKGLVQHMFNLFAAGCCPYICSSWPFWSQILLLFFFSSTYFSCYSKSTYMIVLFFL